MATTINGDGEIGLGGTSSSQGTLKLYEDTDNGTNYVGLQAPASIASNTTFTLPSADGTNGQVLQTDGSGALSFGDKTSVASPLVVTGNASAGAEIRLPEDTDNGSNYVALKAANSIASNLTFTLPSADGTSGQVLQTNASGTLSFGNVAVANGGTGSTSLTANNVLLGNGTSAIQTVAPGTSGNVLTSNGTTWQSTAPSASATGKFLAYGDFDSSTGVVALSWSDTGVKRLQVYVTAGWGGNGEVTFQVGYTTSVISTGTYDQMLQRIQYSSVGNSVSSGRTNWSFGTISSSAAPQAGVIDIGLRTSSGSSNQYPTCVGRVGNTGNAEQIFMTGFSTQVWSTPQFQSIRFYSNASSGPYYGTVTVIGYTE